MYRERRQRESATASSFCKAGQRVSVPLATLVSWTEVRDGGFIDLQTHSCERSPVIIDQPSHWRTNYEIRSTGELEKCSAQNANGSIITIDDIILLDGSPRRRRHW